MQVRPYSADKDGTAVKQMWVEAGWGEYKDHERLFIEEERTLVAEADGEALAMVLSSKGDMRYLNETLALSGIGTVITDLTARKLKLSSRLTAQRVALDAADGFGFGYFDAAGKLSHHLRLGGKGKEEGPFSVRWIAYQTDEQFFELLALIKGFGDQFHQISMSEPPHIALQDLLHLPFYHRRLVADADLRRSAMSR
ncbi:MAG: hypothetical protein ACKVJG_20060 [Candidatus Latescibacterota bacterium]